MYSAHAPPGGGESADDGAKRSQRRVPVLVGAGIQSRDPLAPVRLYGRGYYTSGWCSTLGQSSGVRRVGKRGHE